MICQYLILTNPYIEPAGKNQALQNIDKFKLVSDDDMIQESQIDDKIVYNKTEDLMNLHF